MKERFREKLIFGIIIVPLHEILSSTLQLVRKTIISILLLLALFCVSALHAQNVTRLSNDATVSVLTCAPYEEEVFTVYGHAAMRVKDKANNIDFVFNYGIFSFDKPNFIYRFAKGETDYELGVEDYRDYIIEYEMRGSDVTEQELNLTQPEKQHIWELSGREL
jgi:hypothetical protein